MNGVSPSANALDLVAEAIQLALEFQQHGLLHEAEKLYAGILEVEPAHFDALHLLGVLRQQQGHAAEALELITRALQYDPNSHHAHANRGVVLAKLGQNKEAIACFDRAIAIKPDFAEAHYNRGEALANFDGDEAVASYSNALALRPDYVEATFGLGCALQALGRWSDAVAVFEKVLSLNPAHIGALINRANTLADLGQHRQALAALDQALAVVPNHPEAQWNRSLILLALGDFEQGWKNYEWRWRKTNWANKRRDFWQPLWLGEDPVAGKNMLLYAEQGFGDAIQFVRFAPLVARRGARVIVEANPALHSLFSRVQGVAAVVSKEQRFADFDIHCPLLSLPLAFNVRQDSIPSNVPYLEPSPKRLVQWRSRLPPGPRRAGLVWAGASVHQNDRHRSIALEQLRSLLCIKSLQVVSLQHELRHGDRELLQSTGTLHLGDELTDFEDTAAIISLLDVIITVDTSVAHLAGALAKPTWILLPSNPDWRWMLERDDSPWYPTVRLFRQRDASKWDDVVRRVHECLVAELAKN